MVIDSEEAVGMQLQFNNSPSEEKNQAFLQLLLLGFVFCSFRRPCCEMRERKKKTSCFVFCFATGHTHAHTAHAELVIDWTPSTECTFFTGRAPRSGCSLCLPVRLIPSKSGHGHGHGGRRQQQQTSSSNPPQTL